METIFWTGYSNNERHSIIDKIKSVVTNYGNIVDFKFFSDMSLTMVIEIEELKIDKLYEELGEIIGIDKFDYLNSISKKEKTIYLTITFTKGTGNLLVAVPSVPG